MDSEAIDPVDFREAQHGNWDSAAVGWMEWSEFDDRAFEEAWDAIAQAAEGAGGGSGPLSLTNVVLVASGTG